MEEARQRIAAAEETASAAEPTIRPGYEPTQREEWCVSYAWGDDRPEGRERQAAVERFCAAAAARGIIIVRDRTTSHYGDSITEFAQRVGRGARVFIFLSDKYLRSAFCMHELFEVWRNCRQEDEAFIARMRVWMLPCAKIDEFDDRLTYTVHWKDRFTKMGKAVKKHGPDVLGAGDLADYRRMQDFAVKTPDMLWLVRDVLRPKKFEDFLSYSFD